ncbi:MAG: SMP-30/gluconolactonase/LRE family protein [SAR202 cluster bacterium]|jgi:sugar lactone lactonase YvrE|nr:SMP-30/gluconolactonase/LRE family protein [SAR202 cluster bacterium]MDP6513199.1 SMP-30/gluconolactonase/LRE family protein [SAR202 cluster bacterium]MDP6713386.1 SMP-30/gluconolactonase/LRE family protein [SAR202 cluster bacterium]
MPNSTPEILLGDLMFPEGPRWHEGRLWFSDMHAHEVVAVDMEGNRETIAEVPTWPSGLGWLPDGRMLVVSMTDRKLLRLDPDGLVEAGDMSEFATFHCNDMVVDGQGRAYVGNFGADIFSGQKPRNANLVMVTPEGQASVAATDLMFPNGTVITPDGGTMIVAETRGQRLTAFDVADDGSLSNRRVWAELDVWPDGICLDAENCIWVAAPRAPGAFVRVAEGGEVRDRIDLEDRGGFACMLGGPERRTLFMLEAFGSNPDQIEGPGNGQIRTVEVEVPGVGWP